MKIFINSLFLLFITKACISQTAVKPSDKTHIILCGVRDTAEKWTNIRRTVLNECNWQLECENGNKITQFRLSLVPSGKAYQYFEITIDGNTIPEIYRDMIRNETKSIMLEFIRTEQIEIKSRVKPAMYMII